ncbi:ABC transporter ATP-binding protein [Streptoalloteichus hindustanus]|uniref:ABC-type multidrug transport system, ATPase and permease component n=1 Tax=Streptoalloteichus hindustanus TaxID=2017 RepID=A0A1M5PJ17_STRHI|nr:ABC transporter ATP-binding protein [Streptoalloteichus hindustanus]SHH01705.1 ABC-type multidrug transport system, ATPase and permease component [Streptoalloteichus hindustanus]
MSRGTTREAPQPRPPGERSDRPAGPPEPDESWRGVAAEDQDEVDHQVGARLQARSRRLLRSLLRPHTGGALLALLLVVAENVAQLTGPLLIAAAIDVGVPAALAGRPAPLTWHVGGYVGCGLAGAALRFAFLRLSGRIGQDVLLELRRRVFAHAQRLSLSFHESYTSGRMISRLTSDLSALDDLLEMGLDGLLSSALTVAGVAVLLVWLDPPLGLAVLATFVPLLLLARWFRRRSRSTYRRTRTTVARVIVQFTETMNGVRAVQAFRRERRNESIMDDLSADYRAAQQNSLLLVARFTASVRLVGNLTMVVVLAVGAWRVAHGQLELGLLAAFLLYLRKLYDPLDELAMVANAYSAAVAALEKISGVLEETPSVPEPAHPVPLPDPRGELRFSGVEFRYGEQGPLVLPPLDLHVPAGQTVALVGATGAGKSTLAKLVARFYDPIAGAVTLDGVDLRSVSDADLRRAVVMVTQESFLFEGTVADNIALGRPDASRAEIEEAATAVGAHEFVSALPDGYDTDVRKRGGRLSAGQRQLVAFARAFLAGPRVLVLDEATSSLDLPSERAVQAAMERVLADRTALIIAHRLSTVLVADRVLVMADGRIVEDGPPADLVAGRGRFARLHRAWLDSLAPTTS